MGYRYMIRTFQDANGRDSIQSGTIVSLVPREFSIYAESAHEAERQLRTDIMRGALPGGRVYQICPSLGSPELIRSMAASIDGSFARVFLDPAAGLYSDLRRIRLSRSAQNENFGNSEQPLVA